MQRILIEKPYEFIPRHRGTAVARFLLKTKMYVRHLRNLEGVVSHELRHIDRLRDSLDAGHGILLAANHCRTADPIALGYICKEAPCFMYAMASWHLFHQSAISSWVIHQIGAFSVNREGIDKQAINEAINALVEAERPLVIFPEGATSRCNDVLMPMMDGVSFVARTAAKRRARQGGKVVVHPVAFKYVFKGDIHKACSPVLSEIEQRLGFRPQPDKPLMTRIKQVGQSLLSMKELEAFGAIQSGTIAERQEKLIEQLLQPLENEWIETSVNREIGVVARIKALRSAILPGLAKNEIGEDEKEKRWKHLEDTYLAHQVFLYPRDYLKDPTESRVLETVERFEEDLTDKARIHGNLHVVIDIGEAIEVETKRVRGARDPLMETLQNRLQGMLDELSKLSKPFDEVNRSSEEINRST